ncbi:MAG: hypothetical protein J0L64_06840 [Acidobacteria bacterium]|nr:hypothetical protein [Acidobacteriota bacterium]
MMKLAALALGMACTLGAVTLEEVARLAPKEPVRPAPKALKDAVRAWAEPQFLTVRNPLLVAKAMKAAIERAGLEKVVEDVRLLHPSGQREFVVLVTKMVAACGVDESIYLYQWRDGRWRMLLESLNDGPAQPFAKVFAQSTQIHLSDAIDKGERIFAVGGHHLWCSSFWQPVRFRAWLIASERAMILLDRNHLSYIGGEELELRVRAGSIKARYVIGHPDVAKHSQAIEESYRREGQSVVLKSRTLIAPLEDLDEDLEGDPISYLLQWLEERIAPPGDLDYRVTELNAKLARFQLPKAVSPARIELLPGATGSQAELILHTAGKQTRVTVESRNGQWELEPERP